MVDVALIVIACIVPVVLTFFNLVLMMRYLDATATKGHYFAKLMILIGMLMAECTILLLPLDVGNRAGLVGCGFWNTDCGGLDLALVWQITYCIIFGLVVLVFPFFIFFYEADDEGLAAEDKARAEGTSTCLARLCDFRGCGRAACSAIVYTLITVVISVIVLVVSYIYLSKTNIPYKMTSIDVGSVAFQPVGTPILNLCTPGTCNMPCGTGSCNWASQTLQIDVTFVIYLAALMSFVGWFIFSIYVGIGFVALPLDCFNAFRYRPRPKDAKTLNNMRKSVENKAKELMTVAMNMVGDQVQFSDQAHSKSERRKKGRATVSEVNRYRVLVDMLEQELEDYQMSNPTYYKEHFNPLVPYAKLVFGVISVVLTLAWIIHIIIYMLFTPALYGFLNNYFTWFDQWFPLFGTISVAIFGLYLLLAVAKGNTKFGTRFFLIKVHPMELHKTLMNGFVFNIALVLLCVLPVTQFCSNAFSQYARLTDAEMIFNNQFQYMQFFRYFFQYNVFVFMILIFTLLSLVYFSLCPSDKAHLNRVMDQIRKDNKMNLHKASEKAQRV